MSYNYKYGSDKSHFLYKIIRPLAKLVISAKYKVTFIGAENVPTDRGVVLASNHITALDPVIIGVGCKATLHFIAKKELFEKKTVGWFLSNLNAFPVDRSKFDFTSMDYAVRIVEDGDGLVIFPEGTRSPDFEPHEAKGGVCYIAKKCKCDVVPVSIYTSDKAKPGTRLTVRYGKPIKYEDLNFHEDVEKMKDLRYGSKLIMDSIKGLWRLGHGD